MIDAMQWRMLAAMTVLLIELSAATHLILQQITGDSYVLSSIAVAAVIVVEVRRDLQAWIWNSTRSGPLHR